MVPVPVRGLRVRVEFKTKKLRKQFEDSKAGRRALGEDVVGKYTQRIQIIQQARNLDELMKLPGLHCHPLTGHLDGLYSIKLNDFCRLIVSIEEGVVTVQEVSKHYED
jgi:plasmid maintenance system killer protein